MKKLNWSNFVYQLFITAAVITVIFIELHNSNGGLVSLAWSSPLVILGLIGAYGLVSGKSFHRLPKKIRILFWLVAILGVLILAGLLVFIISLNSCHPTSQQICI